MEKTSSELFGICPYVTTQTLLSGKWSILILWHLSKQETVRFGQLQRMLSPITQATLTKQLRQLENYGLITRHVFPEVPPRVEYALSETGREFVPVLDSIGKFGEKYIHHCKDMEICPANTEFSDFEQKGMTT